MTLNDFFEAIKAECGHGAHVAFELRAQRDSYGRQTMEVTIEDDQLDGPHQYITAPTIGLALQRYQARLKIEETERKMREEPLLVSEELQKTAV